LLGGRPLTARPFSRGSQNRADLRSAAKQPGDGRGRPL